MKPVKFFVLVIFNCLALVGFSQNIIWDKSYGSKLGDQAKAIDQTSDGGYVAAGYIGFDGKDVTTHYGLGQDIWVAKLDSRGDLEWENTYGGTDGEVAYDIEQTNDGGYIIAGFSGSSDKDVSNNYGSGGYADYWLVKTDPSGNIEWENNLGGTSTDIAYSVQQSDDGGYIVAGQSNSNDIDVSGNIGEDDMWIVKLSSGGSIQWENNYGSSKSDGAEEIRQTKDKGFIVVGNTNAADGDVSEINGKEDCWVLKLNNSGDIIWEETYGGSESEYAKAVSQTQDGGFIVAGPSRSSDKDVSGHYKSSVSFSTPDYWVFKLNKNGKIQWNKNYGGTRSDIPNSITQTNSGGYVVAGLTQSSDKDVSTHYGDKFTSDYWALKLKNNGSIQWASNYGGKNKDVAKEIIQAKDGNYVLVGHSSSDDKDVSKTKGGTFYWITKISRGCTPASSSINKSVCNKYTVPSQDKTYFKGGTYYDTLENVTKQGCDSIITINLTIKKVDSSVSQTEGTLKANVSNATYQWLVCDNGYAPVSGATNQSFTPSADGNYAVEVTQNNCTDTSSCYQVETTGIAGNSAKAGFEVYPNPASDQLTIVQQDNVKPQTFQLQTLTGQRLKSGQLSGTERVDVSNLSPGVYLLEVQVEDAVRTNKVVVK